MKKCMFSINGKCNSDYSPLKCNGIDIPDDCTYAYKKKTKTKYKVLDIILKTLGIIAMVLLLYGIIDGIVRVIL